VLVKLVPDNGAPMHHDDRVRLGLGRGNADLDIHLPADVFAPVDHRGLAADIEESVARQHEVLGRGRGCEGSRHERAGRAYLEDMFADHGRLPAGMNIVT
jgi:hypothetical protein